MFNQVPNLINVEARQYPVSIHYNKTTPDDYLEQAFKKVVKIHRTLPGGGILVFLTGKKEILYLQKRLNMEFENKGNKNDGNDYDDDEEEFMKGHVLGDIEKANLPK